MLPKAIQKRITVLHKKKYRKDRQMFLVEGVKGVAEALMSGLVRVVIIEEKRVGEFEEIVALAAKEEVETHYCAQSDIGKIKTTDTFPGVMAIANFPEHSIEAMEGPIICLDKVADPGNVGTVIRTAEWFGVKNVLLTDGSVDQYNPKAVRSTMGSIFRMNVAHSSDIKTDIAAFKERGYTIISLDMDGEPLESVQASLETDQVMYVLGSESHGVRQSILDQSDQIATIPGEGHAESLNVAIAAAITLYSMKK